MKGSYVLKFFRQKTQKTADVVLYFRSALKTFSSAKIGRVLVIAIIVFGVLLAPQPAHAFACGGLCITGIALGVGGALTGVGAAVGNEIAQGILEWIAGFLAATVAAIITIVISVVNLFLTGVSWLTKTIMEYVLNLTLTANYTNVSEPGVVQAAWPIFRDLANMGIILALVAIGLMTVLSLQKGNAKNRLGWLILVALLINFTPLLTGMVIDLSNITARIFFDSAQQSSNAFMASVPLQKSVQNIGQNLDFFGAAATNNFDYGAFLSVITVSIVSIIFILFLIFAHLILAALFLGRTLALWLLVILSPIALLGLIFEKGKLRDLWDRWANAFLQWSIIIIPLVLSLWLAGIFLNNDQWCGQESGTAVVENNLGQYQVVNESGDAVNSANFQDLQEGTITAEAVDEKTGTVGKSFGPVLAPVGTAEEVCNSVTMLLALGALGAGIMGSLNIGAEGSKYITDRAKTYQAKLRGWAARRSKAAVSRQARQKGGRSTGAAGTRLSRSRLARLPLVGGEARKGALRAQRYASGAREGYDQYTKEYKNLTWDELQGHLQSETDPERKAAILRLAADKHKDKFANYWEGLSEKEQEKLGADIGKYEKRFPGTLKELAKGHPALLSNKHVTIPSIEAETPAERFRKIRKMKADIAKEAKTKDIEGWHRNVYSDEALVEELAKQNKLTQNVLESIAKDIKKLTQLETTVSQLEEKRGKSMEEIMRITKSNLSNVHRNPRVAALHLASPKKKVKLEDLSEEEREVLAEEIKGSESKDSEEENEE